jgi:hypothetical protein
LPAPNRDREGADVFTGVFNGADVVDVADAFNVRASVIERSMPAWKGAR